VDTDVAVVGAGTMGSFALWRLAKRGVKAIGFERFEPGHDRGSGHGESRIIRTAYAEGSSYVPLVRSSYPLWRELEREAGVSLLTMTGGLAIGHPGGSLVEGALKSAREHDLAHEALDAGRLRERYPQFAVGAAEVAVYEEAAGVLRPEAAIRSAARQAHELGGTLHVNTVVEAVEEARGGVEIRAGGRTYRARRAVVSVGPWLGKLLPGLGLPLVVERQVLAWFPAREPGLFAPESCPIFVYQEEGLEWYGFPSLDGETVKVAVHHHGQTADPDDIDREVHPEDVGPISRLVRERLPDLIPTPARSQVCMYTNTPDEHFLVGSAPGRPNVVLWGVSRATVSSSLPSWARSQPTSPPRGKLHILSTSSHRAVSHEGSGAVCGGLEEPRR
jgi:sarcosine oxidase